MLYRPLKFVLQFVDFQNDLSSQKSSKTAKHDSIFESKIEFILFSAEIFQILGNYLLRLTICSIPVLNSKTEP